MGLENLKSIFTEGMKKMNNSDLSSIHAGNNLSPYTPPSLSDRIGKSSFDNIKNQKITDTRDYLERGELSQITFPQVGSGASGNNFNNFMTTDDFQSVTYDPRTPGDRFTITPNPYKGTRLTRASLSPNGDTGIGFLFNDKIEYSNSFRTMNTPLGYFSSPNGNDIIVGGNIVNPGGYPIKQSSMETFVSTRGVRPPTYEQTFGGVSSITKNAIPSFNGLTIGQNHLGTVGVDGNNLMTTPTATNKLGGRSWEELYNSNHTAKTDMGYHYSAFVDKGNLDIRHTSGTGSPDRGDEPYVISKIGSGRHRHSTRYKPLRRARTDAQRLIRYHRSRSGVSNFLENMVLWNRTDIPVVMDSKKKGKRKGTKKLIGVPQRFENDYNPLANILYQTQRLRGSSFGPTKIRRSGKGLFRGGISDVDSYEALKAKKLKFGKDTNVSVRSMERGSNYVQSFTESEKQQKKTDRKGRVSRRRRFGDVLTLTPLITHESDIAKADTVRRVPTIDADNNIVHTTGEDKIAKTDYVEKSGLPFYFKDLRDDTYVIFRAFLDGINENIVPTWTPQDYIGRSEPVYSYQKTERDLSFNLKIYAQNPQELDAIYKKLNRLTSMCYPQYAPDKTVTSDQGMNTNKQIPAIRTKPPLVRFRLGDMFGGAGGDINMMLGFIKSISYTIPDEGVWETHLGSQVPKYITAAIQFQVIHEQVPSYMTQFYGKTLGGGSVIENTVGEVNSGGFGDKVPKGKNDKEVGTEIPLTEGGFDPFSVA